MVEDKESEQKDGDISTISIGDISLSSYRLLPEELCSLIIWLLQQKEIKDYLFNIETKKKKTSYAG